MDTQKTLTEIHSLEEEIRGEKTRCKPPNNLPDSPIESLKFLTYGSALVFFRRVRERNSKIKTLRDSLKLCT
jgi:hypothetical protein